MTSFFNKMVTEINKGVSGISENSKNIAEKVKLNMRLQNIEKQEKELCQQLGSLIYNLHTNGDIHIEQCNEICEEILLNKKQSEEIKSSIAALEQNDVHPSFEEVRQITDKIPCKCGCMNKKTDLFCSNCGASINVDKCKTEDDNDEV